MDRAAQLMERFAHDTGLSSEAPPRRYLWTDAHALCTLLGLHEASGADRWAEMARELITQVHGILGSHHPNDGRSGRLGREDHPTEGGSRIGKPFPERRSWEPHDPSEEWNRDGQYLHYLTKWMHALIRAADHMGVLQEHVPVRDEIVDFWVNHGEWSVHEDINRVSLATSLAPGGILGT